MELQIKGDLDLSTFNPHGISVYTDEAGDVQIKCSITAIKRRKERNVLWIKCLPLNELDHFSNFLCENHRARQNLKAHLVFKSCAK